MVEIKVFFYINERSPVLDLVYIIELTRQFGRSFLVSMSSEFAIVSVKNSRFNSFNSIYLDLGSELQSDLIDVGYRFPSPRHCQTLQ